MIKLLSPFRPGFAIAIAFLMVLAAAAIFAAHVAPYDPLAQSLANTFAFPSSKHLLGTDHYGRDVLSRLIWGAQPALLGVLIAVVTTAAIGIPWGLFAGYFGGIPDQVLMRLADALLVFPGIILALVLAAILGPSLTSSMVGLGIVYSPVLARVTRSGVLAVREREYVTLTALYGLSPLYRMWRHVLPNSIAPAIVQITLLSGSALLAQTGLSFLGVGLKPPLPSWGSSLAESFRFIFVSSIPTLAPGLVVVATVLSLYRVGDELRDMLGSPQR